MTKNELKIISLKYRTCASQMLKIDNNDEVQYIKMFIDFIDITEMLSSYVSNCHKINYDFISIIAERPYGHYLEMPDNSEGIIDYGYQLLKYIVEKKASLIAISMGYSDSNRISDSITAFMRKSVEPFVIALREYIEIKFLECDDNPGLLEDENNKTKIFLSYCHKDSKIADLIDKKIQENVSADSVSVSRDIRGVEYHESFKRFMDSINDHDYVVMIISDHYLKSRNCMYEVLETIKDNKYQNKLVYVVLCDEDAVWLKLENEKIGAKVFSAQDQAVYIKYWKNKENEINQQIEDIDDPASTIDLSKELKHIRKILLDLQDLLSFIRDNRGLSLKEHLDTNLDRMLRFMKLKK